MASRILAIYANLDADAPTVVRQHAALVDRLARRMARRVGNPDVYDDLWSAGAIGLLDAAKRFDSTLEIQFEAFASHRIRGAMIDELRRMDHLPRRLRSNLDRLSAVRKELSDRGGEPPAPDQLAKAMGLSVDDLQELEALEQPPIPLDDILALRSSAPGSLELMERADLSRRLAEAVSNLPERLQLILQLYYAEELTLREIAGILGVSEPRVSQLHKDAVKKLRAALVPEGQEPEPGRR
ncbi:MAG TPA: FliA/WhiG family RNA polymerase sigma factor [Vulgatibacter sp.]|nr:FliA/WhiG family RNA polymerase sigma factor [Vulgatibacter sp.]